MTDLAIIMPSWNKEQYIAEALDSIFSQKTHYSYKIIIADDHSTDRTLDIVSVYEKRFPGIITVLRSEKNQKLYKNVLRAYEILDTPYFCVLDPDDYWISENHIENALSFLSLHKDFTIYSAGIRMLSKNNKEEDVKFSSIAVDSDFSDYLNRRAVIAFTQTCVYRNVAFSEGVPARILEMKSSTKEKTFRGDSFRNFLHIREGKAHYEPRIEGCYRLTDSGVYQGLNELGRHLLNAELMVDLWRYDYCKHYELLLWSRKIYKKALKAWHKIENKPSLSKERKMACYNALMRLNKIYRSKIIRLRWCAWKESIQKRYCQYVNKLTRSLNKRVKRYRINKSIRAAKYVHLMYDDKFAKPFVDFLRRNFPIKEHVVICDNFMNFPFDEDECAFKVSKCFKGIKLESPNIKKIICHSLYVRGSVDFFFEHPKLLREKVYWLIYGGDLYQAPRDEKNDFVRKNFKGYLATYDGDVLRAKYQVENIQTVEIPCNINSTMIIDAKNKITKKKYVQVQINNSCDASVIEGLRLLSRFGNHSFRVVAITSYGDMEIKTEVEKVGRSLFGENFISISSLMSPEKYVEHLANNDVLILCQDRQQGMGNVLTSLALGVKVFIKKSVTTYQVLSNEGLVIFDTNSIASLTYDEFLSWENKEINQILSLRSFDDDFVSRSWSKVFTE